MARGTLRIRVVGDASGLEKVLGKTSSTLTKFAKVGVLGAGAAIAGGLAISVKSFADFDAAMTQSTAIMGDVSDAMRKDMSKAAREVAKTTKFSATQAAESYFFLASAGLDAQQSIKALPQVAAFAQAGMFDMALATDLATDAQSALGLKSKDAQQNLKNLTRVTDVLVKANTLANASVEQFALALTQKAGGALRNVGKDIEEGVAVLSVFADQGIKAERAGTILRSTLDDLSAQSRKNAAAFAEVGVKVFDAEGNMRNMADIVSDLEGGLAGMSVEQREATLAQLGFNKRSREGLLALLGNSDALRDYEADLRNAAGTTQEVADKQMQTFWAKLGLVKDQLIDVAISVGQTLMPALEAMADWLSAELPAITAWFDRVSEKFMDLLGIGEESTDGIRESLAGMESDMADKMRKSQAHLEALAGTAQTTESDMRSPFEQMGAMFGEMYDAWLVVWNEDVKPWLQDTFMPWFQEKAVPVLADAGEAAGEAFLKGVWTVVRGIAPRLQDWLTDQFEIGLDKTIPFASPGQRRFQQRPKLPGGAESLEDFRRITEGSGQVIRHVGGTVPGLPSQEVGIIARGGERVSTDEQDRRHVEIKIYGDVGRQELFRLRNLAAVL